jgi:beta-lactamase superfamily II metal-dependent hydrolase
MKLTVFQSDKGDCLLLASADQKHVLVDGGMSSSFTRHAARSLGQLGALDLVYLSHIDQDHIAGILELMDDIVAWRVHDLQLASGNTHHPEPESPRPPEVHAIWHNAFHEQIGANAGPIADMLAATSTALSAANTATIKELAEAQQSLANSIAEAIRLTRRIGDRQLGIPLNQEFDGKLMFVRDSQPVLELGSLTIHVIGPFEEDLRKLRREWNEWLRNNRTQLENIRRRAREDEELLGLSEGERLVRVSVTLAEELGRRDNVTTPNLASLMLFVEEEDKTLLLTGDGHADDILRGLESQGKLDGSGKIHVNVLKVQHHGSEHNIHRDFCDRVTADHYVFCGNGEHRNPDLRVIELIVRSRLQGGDQRRFKLWFNSGEEATEKPANKAHMRKVERLARQLEEESEGRLRSFFLTGSKFTLTV